MTLKKIEQNFLLTLIENYYEKKDESIKRVLQDLYFKKFFDSTDFQKKLKTKFPNFTNDITNSE